MTPNSHFISRVSNNASFSGSQERAAELNAQAAEDALVSRIPDLDDASPEEIAAERLPREAARQHEREEAIRLRVVEEEAALEALAAEAQASIPKPESQGDPLPKVGKGRQRVRRWVEIGKSKKTPRLLLQIWQSDYSIIGFVITMATFTLMKDTGYGPIGVLFFLVAMAEIDAILSIFVVRLSFHQNKHGFYRTEDFERDWLRYRMLLSMTKAALLFVVATSCGASATIACFVMWFFTTTLRLRYIILRWSMDDHYPDLQRWSVFAILSEAGIQPKLRNFNILAILGVLIGFGIAFLF